ncbi:coiled-coil domain-containing protein [Brachionus plicatilis]|uniref:Coiled-coil domain-containing protein n=1 Tax=Brachionus plicatilis TaxID=10195 RepID=A0A3M7SQP7_BRAPC|nr:coiled-coil domain-containing protein [Brachionus plicatilis]
MEEVDTIIIQSLRSNGCDIKQEITSIAQFDQEILIESVSILLNLIQQTTSVNAEKLLTKLPPSTAVKFRLCTKYANICLSLGYKNELGYQTLLYPNETESRKLLMFLVEKLNKENLSSHDEEQNQKNIKSNKNLNFLIAEKTKKLLNKFWIPPYLKPSGLRREDDNFTKEGIRFESKFNALSLITSDFTSNSKIKKFERDFCQKYLKYVTEQSIKANLLNSLIQQNTLNRINENTLINVEQKKEIPKSVKEEAIDELKKSVKIFLEQTIEGSKQETGLINESDLAEIEAQSSTNVKNLFAKVSRFQHSEKLQFSENETEKNISISNAPEQKKEEEITGLKDKLEHLNKEFESFKNEIDSIKQNKIDAAETKNTDQKNQNKSIEDKIAVKKKTVNLINDAPMNILKLKEEINSHEKKMKKLRNEWNNHKEALDVRKKTLENEILGQTEKMNQTIEETKNLKGQIIELSSDLTERDNLIAELAKEMASLEKSESSKHSNRQFYTRRILEICSNIDRQRKEIDKILVETKSIQKELNQMNGKLERIFNTTDELIFKDAKLSETNKAVYRLFININTQYEKLIEDLEQTSHLDRECRDLEEQVNLESQNKIADNMHKVMGDLKQIKKENEELMAKIK